VGKYEVGRTIGEGTFAKVKFAQNTETGESVAMKVLDRSSILKHKMAEQVTELALVFFYPQIMLLGWLAEAFLFSLIPRSVASCCGF
jgi:serine/threonine protein kinase